MEPLGCSNSLLLVLGSKRPLLFLNAQEDKNVPSHLLYDISKLINSSGTSTKLALCSGD